MSRAGAGERGFTLIELLVVLTIGAAGVGGAAAGRDPAAARHRPHDPEVALAIRDQRSTAMRTGLMTTVTAAAIVPMLPRGTEIQEDGLRRNRPALLPQWHVQRRAAGPRGGRWPAGGQCRLADRAGDRGGAVTGRARPGRGGLHAAGDPGGAGDPWDRDHHRVRRDRQRPALRPSRRGSTAPGLVARTCWPAAGSISPRSTGRATAISAAVWAGGSRASPTPARGYPARRRPSRRNRGRTLGGATDQVGETGAGREVVRPTISAEQFGNEQMDGRIARAGSSMLGGRRIGMLGPGAGRHGLGTGTGRRQAQPKEPLRLRLVRVTVEKGGQRFELTGLAVEPRRERTAGFDPHGSASPCRLHPGRAAGQHGGAGAGGGGDDGRPAVRAARADSTDSRRESMEELTLGLSVLRGELERAEPLMVKSASASWSCSRAARPAAVRQCRAALSLWPALSRLRICGYPRRWRHLSDRAAPRRRSIRPRPTLPARRGRRAPDGVAGRPGAAVQLFRQARRTRCGRLAQELADRAKLPQAIRLAAGEDPAWPELVVATRLMAPWYCGVADAAEHRRLQRQAGTGAAQRLEPSGEADQPFGQAGGSSGSSASGAERSTGNSASTFDKGASEPSRRRTGCSAGGDADLHHGHGRGRGGLPGGPSHRRIWHCAASCRRWRHRPCWRRPCSRRWRWWSIASRARFPSQLSWQFADVRVQVRIEGESGKIDLNKADGAMLQGLLRWACPRTRPSRSPMRSWTGATRTRSSGTRRRGSRLWRRRGCQRVPPTGHSPASAELRFVDRQSRHLGDAGTPRHRLLGREQPEPRQAPEQVRRALGSAAVSPPRARPASTLWGRNGTGATRTTAGENASGGARRAAQLRPARCHGSTPRNSVQAALARTRKGAACPAPTPAPPTPGRPVARERRMRPAHGRCFWTCDSPTGTRPLPRP